MLLIDAFQKDNNTFLEIVDLFKNSIKFYSRKLNYDCAETDLIIFLLELLRKIDLSTFKANESLDYYIKKSIKHEYIRLSKKKITELIIENDFIEVIQDDQYNDPFSLIYFTDMIGNLSQRESKILDYKYNQKFTDTEIASLLGLSRQTVYKYRKKSLEKLKNTINM
ncbi:hypothetical protein GC105_08325 [Alkalibaculum sp. M08DMB]|uniref:RNA polymerase sigma-70 region 4 domain-containing protein n=1 Tax=Alkalibaculum sporogenes TaxID=2655001 RepID=A0A6A7K8P4_9FIRM|nr:sigma-70 family RNA polymerase sigma factor [Alkalibaculum sporogenes]MPW25794.1 hypothetical protein [Alkalibaculum sporogenes]